MLDNKILDTIEYHARMLAKTFKLQQADREDVKQELTLKALEVADDFQEGQASLATYIKKCLGNKTVDLARAFQKAMPTVSIDEILRAENNNQQPYRHNKPRIIRIESITPEQTPTQYDHYLDLRLDIEMILQRLSPRQNTLCRMLMRGMTQQEIADDLELSRPRIQQLIRELRPFFVNV